MGVTYAAVAAAHPLAKQAAENNAALADFLEECKTPKWPKQNWRRWRKRRATGLYALHPLDGRRVPIMVANFVLMDYGTGAVMAVPAHDQRDFEFAHKYGLEIRAVIAAEDGQRQISRLPPTPRKVCCLIPANLMVWISNKAFDAICNKLEAQGLGKRTVNFRLRDWGVSRQRYWGAPIPMLTLEDGSVVPAPADQLPVILPEDVVMDGVQSPIKARSRVGENRHNGQPALRETDTFDTFMESSLVFRPLLLPGLRTRHAGYRSCNHWLPVDQCIGGIERACMHLLYARFLPQTAARFWHGENDDHSPACCAKAWCWLMRSTIPKTVHVF